MPSHKIQCAGAFSRVFPYHKLMRSPALSHTEGARTLITGKKQLAKTGKKLNQTIPLQ